MGGKRKNEKGEIKLDREEIKELKTIDFLLSHCMCLFLRLHCFNIVCLKDFGGFSWGKNREGAPQEN